MEGHGRPSCHFLSPSLPIPSGVAGAGRGGRRRSRPHFILHPRSGPSPTGGVNGEEGGAPRDLGRRTGTRGVPPTRIARLGKRAVPAPRPTTQEGRNLPRSDRRKPSRGGGCSSSVLRHPTEGWDRRAISVNTLKFLSKKLH